MTHLLRYRQPLSVIFEENLTTASQTKATFPQAKNIFTRKPPQKTPFLRNLLKVKIINLHRKQCDIDVLGIETPKMETKQVESCVVNTETIELEQFEKCRVPKETRGTLTHLMFTRANAQLHIVATKARAAKSPVSSPLSSRQVSNIVSIPVSTPQSLSPNVVSIPQTPSLQRRLDSPAAKSPTSSPFHSG
ncbi:hypothetical protein P5673_003702 [Acropora cervicornis]|uniref:Uncharacterized protein n=1 Tax=Acropora cervicornis TaxID=6130 RepID=A0AAD9VE53_ACRCE|nr:hypothetical protein P5673_003702 [Acropora cervicornis]